VHKSWCAAAVQVLALDASSAESMACLAAEHFYSDQPELAIGYYRRLLQVRTRGLGGQGLLLPTGLMQGANWVCWVEPLHWQPTSYTEDSRQALSVEKALYALLSHWCATCV
jgi:hypothetical protein